MCWHGFVLLAKKCDGRVKQNKEMFCSGFAWFVSYGNGYAESCLGYAAKCLGMAWNCYSPFCVGPVKKGEEPWWLRIA